MEHRGAIFARGIFFLAAAAAAAEHPFILWTKEDLAAIRAKIEREPWAKVALARMEEEKDPTAGLLRGAALGDAKAAEAETKELLRMVRSPRPQGAAQEINVLRYDLLYDQLTSDERREVESCFRAYIEDHVAKRVIFDPAVFNNSRNYARYDAKTYSRTNWLPNIIWPWKVSANLMAAALRDEKLIRDTWAAYGSWKWYFDEYLCDTGFYSEEFSKMGSTPGAMLLYCLALERLGLDELGFGCKGKGGATMRGHIESLIHLGYPRVDIASSRPHYPMVTTGDLRQGGSSQAFNFPSPAFQHSLVMGYLPPSTSSGQATAMGGNLRWKAHGAWGGTMRGRNPQWDGYSGFTPKMQVPLWFELGHKRWPESGFGYFLAAMRRPDDDRYIPSLLFGIEPIDPAAVKPPPAPSAIWPERGLVTLRAEESPAYWESPAPAVCMRLASDYAHNVHDAFALAGFYAFNRPLYLNRQSVASYAQGWSRSIQSHCGVSVDGAEPKFTSATSIRKGFGPMAKFVAASSNDVYPGTGLSRCLFLTREYLLDITHLVAPAPRRYAWFVHALGHQQGDHGHLWQAAKLPEGVKDLSGVRAFDAGDRAWSVTTLHGCEFADPLVARLPRSWYERQIGVRLTMLGGAGTVVYAAPTPRLLREVRDGKDKRTEEEPSEVGGVTIIVARTAPTTTFAALHEPFEGGKPRITEFRPLAATPEALAVAILGGGINDRAMLRLRPGRRGQTTSLDGGGEALTFGAYAFARIGGDKVEACGDLEAMKLRVEGRPKFLLNGREETAVTEGGLLIFRR
ncbi:MAG: hypothetical protein FJ290_01400 [Planctomycetes bacterium]|nr:hypothetical protein [Planctomycetota bacterium]